MTQITGHILTPGGWFKGSLHFEARIEGIDGIDGTALTPPCAMDKFILPGFIDLHVHGGGGHDTMQGGAAVQAIAAMHARHGTTSMLPTTMTAPIAEIETALRAIGHAASARQAGAARVLGAHLEGPYINPARLGAQANQTGQATLAQVQHLASFAPLRLITLAPEIDGHLALIRRLSESGIRVQIGHSNGTYEDGVAALAHGAAGFTHLFNAMSGLHHRAPGMAGAALAHAEHAELIPDLLHVHAGAIRVALRAIPHLYCVTDATAAAGMPDGAYLLGRQSVHKCLGGVRLADGTLAGSTLTMDQALRNLVELGLSLADASNRVSTYAADFLGLTDRGRLAAGCHADLVVLGRDLRLTAVYVEGEWIDLGRAAP